MLLENFINTGDYDVIRNFDRPERFILGRTGVGKTALATKLASDEENVITINPESLSLGYISNSTIIKELSDLGVDFDLFFRLLWRHVLAVEVLKYHFNITDEKSKITITDKLKEKFKLLKKRNNHSRAIDYLDTYGGSFWQDTDYRIKEITSTVESNLKAELGAKNLPLLANAGTEKSFSETQKAELTSRAQNVINSVQIGELSDILKMLDDAIDDKQKKYFIVIDRLDEKWVDDSVRYRLIKALIETIKDFSVVKQVKPLIILRSDLIMRVYEITRDTGFQEEKYTSLNLYLRWDRNQLKKLLDSRINYLVKKHYSTGLVTHQDVLPEKIGEIITIDYLLDRTLMRPRDIISFFNYCIGEANNSPIINKTMVLAAEREYSRDRLTSIRDEWSGDFPRLEYWDAILQNQEKEFFLSDISIDEVESKCLSFQEANRAKKPPERDLINEKLTMVLEERISYKDFRKYLIQSFYQVGFLGVGLGSDGTPVWSHESRKMLNVEEFTEETIFYIHPCFWSCFNL